MYICINKYKCIYIYAWVPDPDTLHCEQLLGPGKAESAGDARGAFPDWSVTWVEGAYAVSCETADASSLRVAASARALEPGPAEVCERVCERERECERECVCERERARVRVRVRVRVKVRVRV